MWLYAHTHTSEQKECSSLLILLSWQVLPDLMKLIFLITTSHAELAILFRVPMVPFILPVKMSWPWFQLCLLRHPQQLAKHLAYNKWLIDICWLWLGGWMSLLLFSVLPLWSLELSALFLVLTMTIFTMFARQLSKAKGCRWCHWTEGSNI